MKTKYILIAFLLLATSVFAQNEAYHKKGFDLANLEHQIVAGFNVGATAPMPLPREIRSIKAYWPQFTPQLGYNVTYRFHDKWGVGSGILLDYKGMGVKAEVKSLHTIVDVKVGDETGEMEGYFTGKNKTEVKSAYVTLPLYLSYKFNENWKVRAGGYFSYRFSSEFIGNVTDGYLRQGTPIGERVEIDLADFNFGDEIRHFDAGILVGGEYSINKRFGVFTNLSWGLVPIFSSSFKGLGYKMYNIYGTFGLSYTL